MLVADVYASLGIDTTMFNNNIDAARVAIDLLNDKIKRMQGYVKDGYMSLDTYKTHMVGVNQQLGTMNSAMSDFGGASRNFGRATLLVSQGIEDLQYGFSAVLNNIPGVVLALGGGPGLAGTISLVGVGLNVMYTHYDKIAKFFGHGHTKTEAENMAELAKNTKKTADETMRLAEYEGRRSAGDKVLTSHTKEQDKNAKDISSTFTELSQERKHELVNKISDDIKKSGTLIYTEDEKKRLDEARARETGQGYPGATSVAARAAANTLDTTTFGMAGAAAKLREQEAAEGREARMKVEKEALDRQSKQFFDQMISMYETPEKMANQIEKLKKMGGFDDLIAQLEWVQNYGETMDESIDADQKKNEALLKKSEARHKQEEKTAKTKAESDTKAAEAKTKQIYDQEGQQHARSMLPAALRGEIGSEESIAAQLEKATGKKPSKEVLMATQTSLSDLYRKEVEKRSNETGETQDEAIESLRKKAVFDQARKKELEDDSQLPSEKKEDRADKKALNERARNIAKAYGDSIQKTMKRHVEKQGKSIDESADQIEPQLIEYLKQQGVMGEDVNAAVKQVMGDMKVKRTVASTKRDMKRGPVKAPRTPRERPLTGSRNPHRARDAMRQASDRAAEASDRKRLDKSITPDENEVIKTLRSIDDHIKKSTQDIAKIATEGQYGKLA